MHMDHTTEMLSSYACALSYEDLGPEVIHPLDDAELNAKFRGLASPTITDQQCDLALELLWSAEHLPNLDELWDALVV